MPVSSLWAFRHLSGFIFLRFDRGTPRTDRPTAYRFRRRSTASHSGPPIFAEVTSFRHSATSRPIWLNCNGCWLPCLWQETLPLRSAAILPSSCHRINGSSPAGPSQACPNCYEPQKPKRSTRGTAFIGSMDGGWRSNARCDTSSSLAPLAAARHRP